MVNQEIEKLIAEHKEKEYCFYTLLSALPDLLFIMDIEGNYVKYRKGEGYIFIPQDKIVGSNIRDSGMPQKVIELILKQNEEAITSGEMNEITYSLQSPWGVEHFYESRAVKYDEDKSLRIVRDVTEKAIAQKKVDIQLETLEKIAAIVSSELRSPVARIQYILNNDLKDISIETNANSMDEIKATMNLLEQKITKINQLVQLKK
ncbi:MAG: hypothetical protein EAZ07_07805 [Cytophagales bacterium]|nr:MAG: hypothetical protein EAZ07_07805 [Cytophagales bacterium]